MCPMDVCPTERRLDRRGIRLFEMAIRRGGADDGSALIELAVMTPVLILLAFGTGDFGRLMYDAIVVSHAARAGAAYAATSNANAENSSGISQAAQSEAQNLGTITVTSQVVCQCPSGSPLGSSTTTVN